MQFNVYGPFDLPRTKGKTGLVDNNTASKNAFWKDVVDTTVDGLSKACGVYVYCVAAKRGTLPWYVGLTEKRTFDQEALATRQTKSYDLALESKKGLKVGVKPVIFLLPLLTKK